jgi:hypothetical protein
MTMLFFYKQFLIFQAMGVYRPRCKRAHSQPLEGGRGKSELLLRDTLGVKSYNAGHFAANNRIIFWS